MSPEAQEASQLINHPRFIQAWSNVRERIVSQLENTPMGEDEMRTELVVSLQVLKSVKQDIENDINTSALDDAG